MDKEWIVKKFDDYGLVLEDKVVLDAAFDCAEAIAQAHEEELAALERRLTTTEDLAEEVERNGARLQAQMALMIAALQPCASGEEWKETTALINSSYSPIAFARQVCTELLDELSAAPKVLFRGRMEIEHQLNPPDAPHTALRNNAIADPAYHDCLCEGHKWRRGQEVDVIVLECSVKDGPETKSEQEENDE